jgi:hypothetical protein
VFKNSIRSRVSQRKSKSDFAWDQRLGLLLSDLDPVAGNQQLLAKRAAMASLRSAVNELHLFGAPEDILAGAVFVRGVIGRVTARKAGQ